MSMFGLNASERISKFNIPLPERIDRTMLQAYLVEGDLAHISHISKCYPRVTSVKFTNAPGVDVGTVVCGSVFGNVSCS